ncbi:MAG: hypothetical protein KBA51_01455 [Kiritimatiellae bacterium]|nr:hypothetical protein [Kiritimatiellia bacterium]
MTPEESKQASGEDLLDLNFVPTWAREPSTHNPYADYAGGRARREDHDRRDDRRSGDRRPPAGRRDEQRRGGGRPEQRGPRREDRFTRGEREAPRPGPAGRAPEGRPAISRETTHAVAPVDVSFLPDRHGLGGAIHRIQVSRRAFPLAQLAHMFLTRPSLYLVKVEVRPPRPAPARDNSGKPSISLYQCTVCHAVFVNATGVEQHAMAAHVDHFFTIEETAGDPPTGQFKCIARCPRSGRLLGPPNHHGFNEALAEIHAERFSRETLDEYRATIEMVHDPVVIDQWKQEYVKRKLYRIKTAPPEDPPMKWMEAKAWMRGQVPALVREVKRAVTPAPVAIECGDAGLRRAVREAWTREDRFPMSLMLALRPALRHMGMHLFKAGGVSFVTAIRPTPINPDYAVPGIRRALDYLCAHPGATWAQMRQDLFPGGGQEDAEGAALLKDLRWLIDKGHVIEFHDGTLAMPRGGSAPSVAHESRPRSDRPRA